MKNKKLVYTLIGIISIALVALAITYAYWQITKTQQGVNEVTSACLDITLTSDTEAINLQSQYPITNKEGKALTPYKFTITNKCIGDLDYQIALESTGDSTDAISLNAVKMQLDDNSPIVLSKLSSVTPTLVNAYDARKIGSGHMTGEGGPTDDVTHELRLWIDEDAPVTEANKMYTARISVTVGQGIEADRLNSASLAANILNANGGEESIEEIPLASEGVPSSERYLGFGATSKYWFATDYDFEPSTGLYTLSGTKVEATVAECRATAGLCGPYMLSNSNNVTAWDEMYYITKFTHDTQADTSSNHYVTIKSIKAVKTFESPIVDGEYGLYRSTEAVGENHFYYRGDVPNNYVKLGTYKNAFYDYRGYNDYEEYRSYDSIESCNNASEYNQNCQAVKIVEKGSPIYWRIVAINGSGNIRLAYDGIELASNDEEAVRTLNLQSNFNDSDGGDYFSGSALKNIVENWYVNCLDDNTKSVLDESAGFTTGSDIYNIKQPNINWLATIESGMINYPVSIMSADEAMAAGVGYEAVNTYLGNYPSFWVTSLGIEVNGGWHSAGYGYHYVNGAKPVVNLKANVSFDYKNQETAGTIDDPYIILTD